MASFAVALAFAAFAMAPIIGIVLVALRPPGTLGGGIDLSHGLSLENVALAWDQGMFAQSLRSSAIVVSVVVPSATVLALLAGYALGTMRMRLGRVLFSVFLIGLMMPLEALVIPLYYGLRSVGLTNTYWALILPMIALDMPFGVFWMRATFKAMPTALIEAARLDGASTWDILWRILVPVARPAIFTMVILFFMWTWNDFLIALVMVSSQDLRTAPLSVTFFVGQHVADLSLVAAGSILVAAPILIAYVVFQRQFIRGVLAGALRE